MELSLLLFHVDLIAARKETRTDNGNQIRHVNICSKPEEFQCPAGHVISIENVDCRGRGRGRCLSPANQSVSDLCQGHQTCSNVGIRDLFSSHCDDPEGVQCKFRCIPGDSAKCRSNICAENSEGLICPPGSTLHLRGVTCGDGSQECAWDSYNLLASLCEGSSQCEASGLRALLSPHCNAGDRSSNQVLVDYLCVPGKFIHDSCSSFRYRPIKNKFGVLRLPRTSKSQDLTNKKCKWTIAAPDNQQPIRINVLQVQSRVTEKGCDSNFLRIRMMDCDEEKVVVRSLCKLQGSSIHLKSCGPVKITTMSRIQGDESDSFIISYESVSDSEPGSLLSSGLPACVVPDIAIPSVLTLPAKTDVSQKALHDTGHNDLGTKDDNESGSFKITLKMLLIYIFLGALILVLIAALVTVLVRYQRISLQKNRYADSSENVILWKRYEDTAMELFQQNGLVDHTEPATPDIAHHSDKVIATVHHDPLPEQDHDNRVSVGSGISSFLPPKRDSGFKDFLDSLHLNSFSNYNNINDNSEGRSRSASKYDYCELPEPGYNSQDIYQTVHEQDDDQFDGHYSNPNSLSRPGKSLTGHIDGQQHLVSTEDHQPLVIPQIHPSDDYHYCVNNDEYAVVKKPRNRPAKNGRYNPPGGRGYNASSRIDNGSVDFCPTSGPYDKTSHTAVSHPNYRKSREAKWRDEV